jgi:CheY-like chemotaxis protein
MNFLLVDDDIDDREIFSFALQSLDLPVNLLTAENGVEALKMVSDQGAPVPDLIFLDLNMPMMGGKECLRELRKLPWLKEVPIIIYTTSTLEKDKLDTQKLGATDFLSKEASIDQLKATLTELFARHSI